MGKSIGRWRHVWFPKVEVVRNHRRWKRTTKGDDPNGEDSQVTRTRKNERDDTTEGKEVEVG